MHRLNYTNAAKPAMFEFDSSQQLGFPRGSEKEVIVLSIDGGR
jgi:hypothetical protein